MAIPTRVTPNGTAEQGINAPTPVFTWSSGVLADDIGLLLVETANEPVTLNDAQGFVEVIQFGQGVAGAAGSTRLAVFWARAASSTPGVPTFLDPGDHFHCRILTVRGCINSENPISIIASANLGSTSTAVDIPGGVNPAIDSLMLGLVAWAIDASGAHISLQTSTDGAVSEAFDAGTSNGVGGGIGGETIGASAIGAVADITATLDTASQQSLLMLALRSTSIPAGGAGPLVALIEGY